MNILGFYKGLSATNLQGKSETIAEHVSIICIHLFVLNPH